MKHAFWRIVPLSLLLAAIAAPPCRAVDEQVFTSPTIAAKFVLIPSGSFKRGSPDDEPDRVKDEEQYKIKIGKAFYVQTTEVTQGQWKKVMGNNPSGFKDCGDGCPVEQVSWNDVQEFIRKLNSIEGANKYRLPTEAEWEYAARAGTTTPFYTGKCLGTGQANYNGKYPSTGCPKGEFREKTVRVASFAPNPWGLYDMAGNVWEWCQDWYDEYSWRSRLSDPSGPSSGTNKVIRGGCWMDGAKYSRSAQRLYFNPASANSYIGFRLVRMP
ncbi:MAG TPA: formylglycine-generating enzyme family protein [Syntrophales bacterium]|nr:formylglycine-generating enzyme family protein [Syntrophales bacterium]